jgi:hypothetical protein
MSPGSDAGTDEKSVRTEGITRPYELIPESKVNFGLLPAPKNCQISAPKPFKFNLTINILFGLASTFTVPSKNSWG